MKTENRQQSRQRHQAEVRSFLQKEFKHRIWQFSVPPGYGNETYFAGNFHDTYFVKLGSPVINYQAMASLGLTPPVICSGVLSDGTSVLVQPSIKGRIPNRKEFRVFLEKIARMVGEMHHSELIRSILPVASSEHYSKLGLQVLASFQQRWDRYKPQVPSVASWVDEKIAWLAEQLRELPGSGVVSSHNDICNANWLITPQEHLYLIDLDAMSLDDPASDLGAILWWYYPPELRKRFVECAGYRYDEQFQHRMQLRMSIHCLHINLPRDNSFDQFLPANFSHALTDFRAVVGGKENPQGYN